MTDNKIIRNQINLAKEKNQNAFSYLLNTFWNDVYNFQLKRIKNESTAEDITIESFTKAFEKINTYTAYRFSTRLNYRISGKSSVYSNIELNGDVNNLEENFNSLTVIGIKSPQHQRGRRRSNQ